MILSVDRLFDFQRKAVCFPILPSHSPAHDMDSSEFQRLLSLFPVVRSRDYHVDFVASSSQSTSQSVKDEARKGHGGWNEDGEKEAENKDVFWVNLRLAAEKKIGEAEAEKFCNSFRKVYQKLVREGMSEEVARRIIKAQ